MRELIKGKLIRLRALAPGALTRLGSMLNMT